MGYEANPSDPSPSNLERFLSEKYVWLFTLFVLAADIGSSLYLKVPLCKLRIDKLNSDLPIGAIIVFFTLFALIIFSSRTIRYLFFVMTYPAVQLLKRKKTDEEYKREYQESTAGSVIESYLRDYAIENDHSVLYDIYVRHEDHMREHQWTLVFMFLVGAMLAVLPLLGTSTLHVMLFAQFGLSDWWVLLLAFPMMVCSAHSPSDLNYHVYVGRKAAEEINKKET